MEPHINKLLGNEDFGTTNHIPQPSNNKMYGKGPDIMNPRYNEHILPVAWHLVV